MTKNRVQRRYAKSWLKLHGYEIKAVAESVDKREILDQERMMAERFPGKLNREPWAGRYQEIGSMLDPTPVSATMEITRWLTNHIVDPFVKGFQNKRSRQAKNILGE